jgi:ketosteroid isomerase-like protein
MDFRRLAIFTMAIALAVVLAAGPATASVKTDVMATMQQLVNAFNKGDMNMWVTSCAAQTSIIDDFPPHEWLGPTACSDWWKAYDAFSKSQGVTDGVVTLGKPWHVNVTGDRAYLVVPTTYTYKQHGKPVTESGSVFTVVLQKIATRWRVTGWAWAQH